MVLKRRVISLSSYGCPSVESGQEPNSLQTLIEDRLQLRIVLLSGAVIEVPHLRALANAITQLPGDGIPGNEFEEKPTGLSVAEGNHSLLDDGRPRNLLDDRRADRVDVLRHREFGRDVS